MKIAHRNVHPSDIFWQADRNWAWLKDELKTLPGLTVADDEPVFAEPWQAQAFAMTVKLNEQGLFTWSEWAEVFGAEIAAAGPEDAAENYYSHWLAALEKIVEAKGLSNDT